MNLAVYPSPRLSMLQLLPRGGAVATLPMGMRQCAC
jgi:hypothetical protein